MTARTTRTRMPEPLHLRYRSRPRSLLGWLVALLAIASVVAPTWWAFAPAGAGGTGVALYGTAQAGERDQFIEDLEARIAELREEAARLAERARERSGELSEAAREELADQRERLAELQAEAEALLKEAVERGDASWQEAKPHLRESWEQLKEAVRKFGEQASG